MTATQFILLATLLLCLWFLIEQRLHKRHEKLAEFMDYYQSGIKWIRDEADRTNKTDAEKTSMYIRIASKKSFCKRTHKMIEELWQLWRSKYSWIGK